MLNLLRISKKPHYSSALLITIYALSITVTPILAKSSPRIVSAKVNKSQVNHRPESYALLLNNTLQPSLLADPILNIGDVTANEGDDGILNSATFTITLSAPSQQTVSVMASTAPGTATSDIDFGAGFLNLTIDAGKTSQTITVFVKGDSLVEGTEQFFLNLSNPVNATIADGQGVGTIVDDDALLLLTEPNVQRAAAVDSVNFTRDTFAIRNDVNFSADDRTRVILFAIGLKMLPGETASAVTATAEDSQGTIRPLEIEFVGKVPTYDWLTQVVLKLNDQIALTGDVKIKITLRGVTSNTVLVGVKPQ
jgi:hypothetical protein